LITFRNYSLITYVVVHIVKVKTLSEGHI